MNILLIGNGFDMAHGLPTKYTDKDILRDLILHDNVYTTIFTMKGLMKMVKVIMEEKNLDKRLQILLK